jgi:hypothetical protein
MKKLVLIVVTVTGLVTAALIAGSYICNKPPTSLEAPRPSTLSIATPEPRPCTPVKIQELAIEGETEISICFQERIFLEKDRFSLNFVGYQDDRCQVEDNDACATAGEAYILLSFSSSEVDPTILKLPWSGGVQTWEDSVRAKIYEFELRTLVFDRSVYNTAASHSYRAVVAVRPIAPNSSVQ